jgi:hypothetical protein
MRKNSTGVEPHCLLETNDLPDKGMLLPARAGGKSEVAIVVGAGTGVATFRRVGSGVGSGVGEGEGVAEGIVDRLAEFG